MPRLMTIGYGLVIEQPNPGGSFRLSRERHPLDSIELTRDEAMELCGVLLVATMPKGRTLQLVTAILDEVRGS